MIAVCELMREVEREYGAHVRTGCGSGWLNQILSQVVASGSSLARSPYDSLRIKRPLPQVVLTCTLLFVRLSLPATIKSNRREHQMANRTATIQTNKGTIKFELLEEDAPKTTENFRLLAERGYYDGVIFHRCIKGFMIHGVDPDGTGRGGQSAWGGEFADEINTSYDVYKRSYQASMVAIVNARYLTN